MRNTIICPVCGREYLPEEIFTRKSMYGKPQHIVRNEYGKILSFEGSSAFLEETYMCDKCDAFFRVNGKMVFNSTVAVKPDVSDEYTSKLVKTTL